MQEPPYHNDNPYTSYGSGSSSQENPSPYGNAGGQNYGNQNQPGSPSGQNYGNQNQPYGSPSGQNYGNQDQPYGNPVGQGYGNQGQNYANQPYGYGAPVPPVAQSNGLAIAALIVGIISIVLCWIPFFDFVPAIIGLILSLLARRNPVQRGLSLAGLILSIVALVVSVIYLIFLVIAIIHAANSQ